MLKGWSLMGDALAHAIVPGVALAYLAGCRSRSAPSPPGLLAALAMAVVRVRITPLREDAVIGWCSPPCSSLGLLMASRSTRPRSTSRPSCSATSWRIADEDVVQVAIIAAVVARHPDRCCWKDLMLAFFDPRTTPAPWG